MNNTISNTPRERFARGYLTWSLGLVCTWLVGCATQNQPAFKTAAAAEGAVAKDLSVPAGKSVIYVIQGNRERLQTVIQVDEKDVCRLAERTFYRAVLEPGQHQLGIRCEGQWGNAGVENPKSFKIWKQLIIDVEADHVYFFSAGVVESTSGVVTGFFQPGIESWATAILRKSSDWLGRASIRDRRNRLTAELIGP